jgi:hypothetical protein
MTTNIQLLDLVKKLNIPHFRGIYNRDSLPDKPLEIENGILHSRDENDIRTGHWTSFYINHDKVYYFDSFGITPTKEFCKYVSPLQIITHNFQIQQLEDENCGELCVLFLYLINKGIDYFDVILSLAEV